MASLNKVMLIGRLTDDPQEARTLPNSQSTVVSFRFAVGRSKKRPDGSWENDPNPLYIDCDVYSRPDDRRRLTEVVTMYAKKGTQMYVEGTLKFEQWQDRDNPTQKRSKHKLIVTSVEFIGSAQGSGEGGGGGDEEMGSQAPAPRAAAPRSAPPARNNAPQTNTGGRGNTPPAKSGGYSNYNPMDDGPSHNGGGDDDIPF